MSKHRRERCKQPRSTSSERKSPARRTGMVHKTLTAATAPVIFAGAAALVISLPLFAASTGMLLFQQKNCAACHTIGKGKLTGPDLVVARSRSDAELRAALTRMEKMVGPLSDEQKGALIDYLKSPEAGTGGGGAAAPATTTAPPASPVAQAPAGAPQPAAGAAVVTSKASEGFIDYGRQLFTGHRPFSGGGMACMSCHNAEGSGATMGPDLSGVAGRYPAAALKNACRTTPFPSMKDLYADHPVTEEEAADLTAYFQSLAGKPAEECPVPVSGLGFTGVAVMLGLIGWGYRARNTGARSKLRPK